MNKDIQYRIVQIESKKQGSPYHEMMTGKLCVVVAAKIGCRGCLAVQTLDESCTPRWFSTSPVIRVDDYDYAMVIETENTVYTLKKEDCDDLS